MTHKALAKKLFNRQYLMLVFINFLVSISFSMVSTLMAKYAVHIGMTVALAGSLTGMFSIASMVVRPFTGWMNDLLNNRRLLLWATFVMGLCTLCYGLSTSYSMLIIIRMLHGAAFAFSSTVNMALIPSLVPRGRVTEGVSYFGVATSIGMAIGPSLGLELASAAGYPLNFTCSAIIALIAASLVPILPSMKKENKQQKTFHIRLSDIIAKECLIYTLVDVTIASANGLENALLAMLGAQAGLHNIGWYFSISAVTLCITRLFVGKLADRKGVSFVLYPGLMCMGIGFLLLWKADAAWQFALASVIKTLGIGLARPAIQAACLNAVPPQRRGSASSTYYIGSDIGQGCAPAIGGYLVDVSGGKDYGVPFAFFTLPLAVSGIIYALYTKWKKQGVKHNDAG